MREFRDESGALWEAFVEGQEGDDYKGRFGFRVRSKEGGNGEAFSLDDVRWNSTKTAERTLNTMAEKELRRRLRIARGRGA